MATGNEALNRLWAQAITDAAKPYGDALIDAIVQQDEMDYLSFRATMPKPKPLTRRQRMKARIDALSQRFKDALAVLSGRMEARDPDDYD